MFGRVQSCHVRVTNLPIAPLEMDLRAFTMTTLEYAHTTVVQSRLVKRYPYTDNRTLRRHIELRAVLMPWFFTPDRRRLDQCHVMEHG